MSGDPAASIRQFVDFLDPRPFGGVMELSATDMPKCGRAVGYFDNLDMLAQGVVGAEATGAGNFFVTLNPVRPDLLARAANRVEKFARQRTADADIVVVRVVLFDVDAERPSGICATVHEKSAAYALADATIRLIDELRPTAGRAIGDSGNGYYCVLQIEPLPPGPETTAKIAEVYRLVDRQARLRVPGGVAEGAKLDFTTGNPARLVRLLGTTNRKGDDLPQLGRPWRRSAVSIRPGTPVNLDNLLADLQARVASACAPNSPPANAQPSSVTSSHCGQDLMRRVSGWLDEHRITYRPKEKEGWRCIFELRHCPFHPPGHPDADQHVFECAITIGKDDRLGASCMHETSRGWREFKEKLGGWIDDTVAGPKYADHDGQLCEVKSSTDENGKSTITYSPLCNFTAEITADVTVEDGDDSQRSYDIAGRIKGGASFSGRVPAAEFESENKARARIAGIGGAGVRFFPRKTEQVIDAIKAVSRPRLETVYASLGWTRIGGAPVFVTPSACIGANGAVDGVRTDVGDLAVLRRYGLPIDDAADTVTVVRECLGLLNLGAARVLYPSMSLALGAPLASTLPPGPVHLTGTTGQWKTELSLTLSSFFGDFRRKKDLLSWTSSPAAISRTGHVAKDHLLVADDLKNPKKEVLDQVWQNVGDRTGRARARSDMSLRRTFVVRAAFLSNGENLPQGEASVIARMLIVHVFPGWCTAQQLTNAQGLRPRLPFAMRAYIQWLAVRWSEIERDLPGHCDTLRDLLRKRLPSGSHVRIAETMAVVACGLITFLSFAEEIGAVTRAEVGEHHGRLLNAVVAAGAETASASHGERASGIYVATLDALLTAGEVRLDPRAEPLEDSPHRLVPRVGWFDAAGIYLEPEAAFQQIAAHRRRAGVPLEVSKRALHGQLDDDGHLVTRGDGEHTIVLRIGSGTRRILHIKPGVLQWVAPIVT